MKRFAVQISVNLAILAGLLIIAEGVASYILLIRDITTTAPIAERRHTQYDPELGWINIPNIDIADMYGPGIYLKTNAQGFRNDYVFEVKVPDGKHRVICSGDSYTLGYGVANDHTWCQLLAAIDPQIEPVNMGQGGYGVDQAYLWFMRDGKQLEYDTHIFAFNMSDFRRMQSDRFLGYAKPVLAMEEGKLMATNVPVARFTYKFPWLTTNWDNLKGLRTVQFFNRALTKLALTAKQADTQADEETRKVVLKIFEDLKTLSQQRSSEFILVYLPTRADLTRDTSKDWIEFVEQAAADLDIPFINLIASFQSLPYEDAVGLFAGHFSENGNEVVAEMIHSSLRTSSAATK